MSKGIGLIKSRFFIGAETWIGHVDDKSIAACELLCCRMSLTGGWTRNKTNGHELIRKVFINVLI